MFLSVPSEEHADLTFYLLHYVNEVDKLVDDLRKEAAPYRELWRLIQNLQSIHSKVRSYTYWSSRPTMELKSRAFQYGCRLVHARRPRSLDERRFVELQFVMNHDPGVQLSVEQWLEFLQPHGPLAAIQPPIYPAHDHPPIPQIERRRFVEAVEDALSRVLFACYSMHHRLRASKR